MTVKEAGESVSYETFDSSEFEDDLSFEKDEKESESEVEEKDDDGVKEKLTPEEAFGDDDKSSDDEVKEEEATEDSKEADKADYEPNLKYKVYDQEREFPEQLKGFVKDKETEEYFRTLLAKADGLDEMKPRHQEIVGERDQYKGQVDFYQRDVNRVLELRDKAPHLFASELGISDDWIIQRAKEIVTAKETPETYESFRNNRNLSVQNYNQQLFVEQQQMDLQRSRLSNSQMEMNNALSHPEIASFRQKFDALHGIGAFEAEALKHGYYQFERTKQNIPAIEAVKHVYEFHKKNFSVAEAQVQTAPADSKVKERVKVDPIPNVGKGKNVSPMTRKFKTIKEMREYSDKHGDSNW